LKKVLISGCRKEGGADVAHHHEGDRSPFSAHSQYIVDLGRLVLFARRRVNAFFFRYDHRLIVTIQNDAMMVGMDSPLVDDPLLGRVAMEGQ